MFALALQKGGVDRDQALTRLGIAQVQQGKYAEAQGDFRASFGRPRGRRADVDRLRRNPRLIAVRIGERAARKVRLPRRFLSDVELEQHHVAVLDEVFLAFLAQLAGLARAGLAAERDVVVVGDRLGADEAALEIGVDLARGLRRLGARRGRSRRALPWGRR